jgi:lysine 2,3-aminomutase
MKSRVKPYYLFQCDPIIGASHFRTNIKVGLEIIKKLRGRNSGYAVPTYALDVPGGGKVPLLPEYIKSRDKNFIYVENYEGKIFKYPDKE